MLFAVQGLDKPGSGDLRAARRADHLAHLDRHRDRVELAGPLLDPQGAMIGSLLILDFPDRAALDAFLADDPYTQAGLFGSLAIHAFRRVIAK